MPGVAVMIRAQYFVPLAALIASLSIGDLRVRADDTFFVKHVAPILSRHCLKCHDQGRAQGDVDLETGRSLIDDGYLVPGEPSESRLLELVESDDEDERMPREGPALSHDDVAAIRRWIAEGAKWPKGYRVLPSHLFDRSWWSLQPLRPHPVPDVPGKWRRHVRNPIDAFVLKKLEQARLEPSPPADRPTLIRRLYFDLWGLPPSPREIADFVHDERPDAYERVVDRLLASPRYGERWARHWLDVARYADTHGFDKDKVRPNAWRYRDYVIGALNDDRPYRRFVLEQIAGDVLFPDSSDAIVATGFVAAGPFDFVGQIEVANGTMEKRRVRNLDRDEMLTAVMNVFASTTIQCARSHHHPFDPFRQEDYYRLQSVFAGVDRADRLVDPKDDVLRRQLMRQLTQARRTLDSLKKPGEKSGGDNGAEADDTSAQLKQAIGRYEAELRELMKRPKAFVLASDFDGTSNFVPTRGKIRTVRRLNRGNVGAPVGPELEPRSPAILPELDSAMQGDFTKEGARRAALARWLTDRENPLVWRSIVNRVWHYHFGRGIVATLNDFGKMGAKPTHPELLDWLALRFRDQGQSLKELHRLIVTSATYRQSSRGRDRAERIDSGNQLLWRMNRRRLDAESIHDTLLVISDRMQWEMGGPGFRNFAFESDHSPRYHYHRSDPMDPAQHRRAIFRFVVRSVPDPWMETLDCADPSLSVARRLETTTPLQSLALLNHPFVLAMVEEFATRVDGETRDAQTAARRAFELAIGRQPNRSEAALLEEAVDRVGLVATCRLIVNLNEFLFVD